jgi:hypothetical protein
LIPLKALQMAGKPGKGIKGITMIPFGSAA